MAFFDLPEDPTKKRAKKKVRKKATPKAKVSRKKAPKRRPAPKAKAPRKKVVARRRAPGLVPADRPRRVAVPEREFNKILQAGDWPGGGDKKTFTQRGVTFWPWLVLENKVAARVVLPSGRHSAVVEFVRAGSPLDT